MCFTLFVKTSYSLLQSRSTALPSLLWQNRELKEELPALLTDRATSASQPTEQLLHWCCWSIPGSTVDIRSFRDWCSHFSILPQKPKNVLSVLQNMLRIKLICTLFYFNLFYFPMRTKYKSMLPAKCLRNIPYNIQNQKHNWSLVQSALTDQLQSAQHRKCRKINASLTSTNLIWRIKWEPRKTTAKYHMILLTTKYDLKDI